MSLCLRPAFLLLLSALAVVVYGQNQQFDSENLSSLLRDTSLVQKQIDCVLDRAPCDRLGQNIKDVIPEAVGNNCGRCTPRQAANARTLISFIQSGYPEVWDQIQARYI